MDVTHNLQKEELLTYSSEFVGIGAGYVTPNQLDCSRSVYVHKVDKIACSFPLK